MPENLGTFEYRESQRERFHSHELIDEWYKAYPKIFDAQDFALAVHQNDARMRYHFFEWLAAVMLYHTHGSLSLVEQYEKPGHKRKQDILSRIVPPDVFDLITNHESNFGGVQCPDLLVYAPDFSDWFFCEVKGDRDTLKPEPRRFFEVLEKASRKSVRLIDFKVANDQPPSRSGKAEPEAKYDEAAEPK